MIILKDIKDLTEKVIGNIIKKHKSSTLPRMLKLEDYYKSKNDILARQMSDPIKPNNRIANPYASYITDTLVGYFIGEPITYNSADERALEELQLNLHFILQPHNLKNKDGEPILGPSPCKDLKISIIFIKLLS